MKLSFSFYQEKHKDKETKPAITGMHKLKGNFYFEMKKKNQFQL